MSLLAQVRDAPEVGAHERRDQLHKRAQLDAEAALRAFRERIRGTDTSTAPAESLLSRLGRHLIDNMRFQLDRLHIRYEHPASADEDGFACGGMIQSLEVCSANIHLPPEPGRHFWRSREETVETTLSPLPSNGDWLHRLMVLRGISLYWHTGAPLQQAAVRLRGQRPEPLDTPPAVAEVLSPMDASLQVRMLRGRAHAEPHEPRQSCVCHVARPVEIGISSRQMRGLMQVPPMSCDPQISCRAPSGLSASDR